MYTWKHGVQIGTNRYKWVWMGADGCVGVWGARGTPKQGNQGSFKVVQVRIWALWPGKFPRTSRFAKKQKNMYGTLRMGVYGLEWVRVDA